MKKEMPPEYYDKVYKNPKHLKNIEESGYYELYKKAVDSIPTICSERIILDVGCGTGKIASLIKKKGFKKYTGIDFSKTAINIAKKMYPEFNFENIDLFEFHKKNGFENYNTFILLETLEHIQDDIKVLSLIPKNSVIIISVPNSNFESHVRFFKTIEEVLDRYKNIFDNRYIQRYTIENPKKPGKKIFLISGFKS